jgi:hypothetical protein
VFDPRLSGKPGLIARLTTSANPAVGPERIRALTFGNFVGQSVNQCFREIFKLINVLTSP